jgi:hypothetical protein
MRRSSRITAERIVRSVEAQRPATFELRGSVPVGISQTETNRAKFAGVGIDEFARHAEGARQFPDRRTTAPH